MLFVILLLAMFLPEAHSNEKQKASLRFGVVPQQSATKLAEMWGPLVSELSKDINVEVRFETARDIPTFEKRLFEGLYDISYMNPYHYTVFSSSPGYVAIAKKNGAYIKGIIVCRKDSPLDSVEDLRGGDLAFPAPAAFAAAILPESMLRRSKIPYRPVYVHSHDSVYRSVSLGLFPAGGGIHRTLESMEPKVRDTLKVLWESSGYTPHAVAVHPKLSKELRVKIQGALIRLSEREEMRPLFEGVNIPSFEAADDSDWDDVRTLNINLLEDLIRER